MESMETPRLRLEFEDRKILSKSQKSNGLKRSWLLLKPQFQTVSDLSSYLIHIFHLDRSCPNGILLSMDGFVLPPFESTNILKDKDIICVKKKGSKLSEIVNVDDGVKSIEEVEIVDKQPVLTDVPLLANEEFEKEIGGYQSAEEDDEDHQSEETLPAKNSTVKNAASKKRKATKNLQSPKRKKRRSMASSEAVEVDVAKEKVENAHNERVLPVKKLHRKKKVSERKNKPDIASTPEKAAENNENFDSMTSSKRCGQLEENGTCNLDVPDKPDGTKKTPSRSARRKKAKRQWLRELTKAEKQELVERRIAEGERRKKSAAAKKGLMTACDLDVPQLNKKRSVAEEKRKKSVPKKGLMALFPDRSSDVDDEVIPVVIRPGHIRFEPLGDKVVQQIEVPVETFKSNGIDNKKKGQKRGREKFLSSRGNDHRDNKDDHRGVDKDDHRDVDKECSDVVAVVKEAVVNIPIDFDKLEPLTSSLKEGDVIAYRLLELSSDWTPELSSFRVGKTSFYDPESNRVALKPVSGYPVIFQNADGDTTSQQPDNSIYKEDGSLEIDFTSLVDLRLVEHGKLVSAKAVTGVINGGPAATKDATPGTAPQNNDKVTFAPTPEKEANVWDEISKSLSAKKAELSQETDWTQLNSGRSSSSYRAPRGSALGPTMALLRARNDI